MKIITDNAQWVSVGQCTAVRTFLESGSSPYIRAGAIPLLHYIILCFRFESHLIHTSLQIRATFRIKPFWNIVIRHRAWWWGRPGCSTILIIISHNMSQILDGVHLLTSFIRCRVTPSIRKILIDATFRKLRVIFHLMFVFRIGIHYI